jgi:DNA-binding MarR family transcriptional regulator
VTEVSRIGESEWDVWRSFYAMRRRLDHALEVQLQRDSGISRPDFEILIALFNAPDRRLRVRELISTIGWEKSRVSHQVTRMEKRGLVTKFECDSDRRGSWVELTSTGRKVILGAMREHSDTIKRYFFDALSPDELAVIGTASASIISAIEPTPCDASLALDNVEPAGSSTVAE